MNDKNIKKCVGNFLVYDFWTIKVRKFTKTFVNIFFLRNPNDQVFHTECSFTRIFIECLPILELDYLI